MSSLPFACLFVSATLAISAPVLVCGAPAGETRERPAAQYQLKIPAVPLADALSQFGVQTGYTVVYAPELVLGRQSVAVAGKLTAASALDTLLRGTGLSWNRVNDTTVMVTRTQDVSMAMVAVDAGVDAARQAPDIGGKNVDQMIVEGQRESFAPLAGGNLDLPRSIDDVQPYYVFDSADIDRSGTADVEEFLRQHLTMNAVGMSNVQDAESLRGNTSSVNLRGLGADKTLILVDGRRTAEVNLGASNYQPDLNGIPLNAIERIEVLPSSASGIYGGSAIGGVVNVILKRDFSGGNLRLTYDDTWSGDSPRRNASLSYGMALEEGRTRLRFSASASERKPLVLEARADIYRRNLADIFTRAPNFLSTGATSPWLGSLPNITLTTATGSLALKNPGGTPIPLNARNTYIPAGTAPDTPTSELRAGLLANAGQWDLELPRSTQSPTGLLRPIGASPQSRSLTVSAQRQMLSWLDLGIELRLNENNSRSLVHPLTSINVQGAFAINPFTSTVRLRVPDTTHAIANSTSQQRAALLTAGMRLPGGWAGTLDYSWSEHRYRYDGMTPDAVRQTLDLRTGALNPFVDTLLYPLNLQDYLLPYSNAGHSRLNTVTLRGQGPLPMLPWGRPWLVAGMEHRVSMLPERFDLYENEAQPAASYHVLYYARESVTDSGYLEATVPLMSPSRLMRSLELQFAGRVERYEVDTGTPSVVTHYNLNPPASQYRTPNIDNQAPLFSRTSYSSRNYTVGLKYQPVKDMTLRVSSATAFVPPVPSQLISEPVRTAFAGNTELVDDPVTGERRSGDYEIITGGNPNLRPQNSRSLNAGLIWVPKRHADMDLRLNLEYYRIQQFDAIATLSPQQIVQEEQIHYDRVTRDAAQSITRIDASALNLYLRDTTGWDLSVDYALDTVAGRFSARVAQSFIVKLKEQSSRERPMYDLAGLVNEGGGVKYNASATLNWEAGGLTLGWTTRYFDAYKQYGAAGGRQSLQTGNGGPVGSYIVAQGSDTVPSQVYHDFVLGYSFRQATGSPRRMQDGWLSGLALKLGVRNVFDTVPPLDAYRSGTYYISPLGDARLRQFWLNASMDF